MTEGVHEMSRAIGGLEASVKSLTDTWQRQDRDATEGRRALHKKVDELKSQQAILTQKVDDQTKKLAEELAEVKPAIKRFEAQRQRVEGARSAVKVMWIAAVAFATGLGYAGHELLLYFWPPKGH